MPQITPFCWHKYCTRLPQAAARKQRRAACEKKTKKGKPEPDWVVEEDTVSVSVGRGTSVTCLPLDSASRGRPVNAPHPQNHRSLWSQPMTTRQKLTLLLLSSIPHLTLYGGMAAWVLHQDAGYTGDFDLFIEGMSSRQMDRALRKRTSVSFWGFYGVASEPPTASGSIYPTNSTNPFNPARFARKLRTHDLPAT